MKKRTMEDFSFLSVRLSSSHFEVRRLLRFFTTVFLLTVIVHNSAQGEEGVAPTGPPFSAPAQGVTMPDEWLQEPIHHEPAIGAVDLVINLDQSSGPLLQEIIKEYAKENGLRVHINSGTCGVSNRLLFQKQLDIGTFCCPPGTEDRFPGLRFHTLGISPIIIIVSPLNPLESISFNDAQRIFMGEIRRWSDLAEFPVHKMSEDPIQPVAFIHCKKRPGHWRLLLDNEDIFAARLTTVLSIPDMIYAVASNSRAIGYDSPYTALRFYKKEKGSVKYLKLDKLDPLDLDHLTAGRYPLYRTFTVTTWEKGPSAKETAEHLVGYLKEYFAIHGAGFSIVDAGRLRQAGWKFHDEELVGGPVKVPLSDIENR